MWAKRPGVIVMNGQVLTKAPLRRRFGRVSSNRIATGFPAKEDAMPVQVLMREGLEDPRWRAGLENLGKTMGATHVAYGYGDPQSIIMPFWSTMPQGFLERYMEDACYERDTLAPAIAGSAKPLVFEPAKLGDSFGEIFLEMGGLYKLARPSFGVPLIGTGGNIAGVAFYGVEMPRDLKGRLRLLRRAESEVQKFHRGVMISSAGWGWLGAPEFDSREIRCLYMAASGYSAKEMAAALDLSQRSIDAALIHARKKLGANSHLEAVAQAVYRRLVRPSLMDDVLGLPACAAG